MNDQTIYTVLLSKPIRSEIGETPVFGFSYRIKKTDDGICLFEHGTNYALILWDKDGPELAELTEQMVKERIEEVLNG